MGYGRGDLTFGPLLTHLQLTAPRRARTLPGAGVDETHRTGGEDCDHGEGPELRRSHAGVQGRHRREGRGRSDGERCGACQDRPQDDNDPARYCGEGQGGDQGQEVTVPATAPVSARVQSHGAHGTLDRGWGSALSGSGLGQAVSPGGDFVSLS